MLISDNRMKITDAFDRLNAEHESRWLDRVFLPPTDFDSIARMRSVIVFGEEGSGKTALRMALTHQAQTQKQDMPLIVEWQPGIPTGILADEFVKFFLQEILNVAASALLERVGQNPGLFVNASKWVQEKIIWFLHNYLSTESDLLLLRFENQFSGDGMKMLKDIFERSPRKILLANTPQPRILAEVVGLFEQIGYAGITVLVDRLDAWLEIDPEHLNLLLKTLFSTLALFEDPGFALKVMCPEKLRSAIISSTGIARRRIDVYQLKWSTTLLIQLVEIRLAHRLGKLNIQLDDLTADRGIVSRLKRYGGNSPRGWLDILRPLADAYSRQENPQPLSLEETTSIYVLYPPKLKLDIETNQILIGSSPVHEISTSAIRLLRYLYLLPSRSCGKRELYYKGLRELAYIPENGDPQWEAPTVLNGAMDTALWRLRQSLEADPKKPIYVISQRGKGIIKLENLW